MKPRNETKAARICRLYAMGIYTVKEIADIVGCRPEYVRVAARQRRGRGMSEIDLRYKYSNRGQEVRQRWNALRLPAKRAYANAFRETGSHEKARAAYASAIQEAAHA